MNQPYIPLHVFSNDGHHRILCAHEIIQKGDQYFDKHNGWQPSICVGDHAGSQYVPSTRRYRREVKEGDSPLCDEPEIPWHGWSDPINPQPSEIDEKARANATKLAPAIHRRMEKLDKDPPSAFANMAGVTPYLCDKANSEFGEWRQKLRMLSVDLENEQQSFEDWVEDEDYDEARFFITELIRKANDISQHLRRKPTKQ